MAATNNKKGGMLLSLGGFIIFTGDQICLEISAFHCSGSSIYLKYLDADRKKRQGWNFHLKYLVVNERHSSEILNVILPNFPFPIALTLGFSFNHFLFSASVVVMRRRRWPCNTCRMECTGPFHLCDYILPWPMPYFELYALFKRFVKNLPPKC